MPAPTDPAPGEDRCGGRHTAPRTPLLRRPPVIAGAGAVAVLGVLVAGAAALGRPSGDALAGASSSAPVAASSAPSSPAAGGAATTLSAPVPTGAAASTDTGSPRSTATAASAEALRELEANPRIDVSQQARQVLGSRPVDLRLATLLVQLASQQRLSVSEVPVAASGAADDPVRGVVLDRLDGQPVATAPEAVAALQRQLTAQDPAYRAQATVQQGQDGEASLLVVLPPVTG